MQLWATGNRLHPELAAELGSIIYIVPIFRHEIYKIEGLWVLPRETIESCITFPEIYCVQATCGWFIVSATST